MHKTSKQLEEQQEILSAVMHQIYKDVRDGEGQAIYEMLERVPNYILKGYLKEAEHHAKLRWN
jgi:hypothetical protein